MTHFSKVPCVEYLGVIFGTLQCGYAHPGGALDYLLIIEKNSVYKYAYICAYILYMIKPIKRKFSKLSLVDEANISV